jgi:uncharacterized membrane protein YjgN (DUF898 family)
MVNTMQQVGGSIGTALLSTVAFHATSRYLTSHTNGAGTRALTQQAATHGYTTAFAVAALVFLAAAVICGALIRSHPAQTSTADPAAHSEPAAIRS